MVGVTADHSQFELFIELHCAEETAVYYRKLRHQQDIVFDKKRENKESLTEEECNEALTLYTKHQLAERKVTLIKEKLGIK